MAFTWVGVLGLVVGVLAKQWPTWLLPVIGFGVALFALDAFMRWGFTSPNSCFIIVTQTITATYAFSLVLPGAFLFLALFVFALIALIYGIVKEKLVSGVVVFILLTVVGLLPAIVDFTLLVLALSSLSILLAALQSKQFREKLGAEM